MTTPALNQAHGMKNISVEMLESVKDESSANAAEYQEYLRLDDHFQGPRKKKLLWKVDSRVLSVLAVLYLIGYVDRSNIGNAVLFGLKEDLKLTVEDYNNALMSFFFTYALFDIPSVLLLKRIGPALYLEIAMTGFGLVTLCTAFCFNKAGLVFILSTWYSTYELQTRISIFYAGASASGAFAGLLGYAIANLDHKLGYRAWRWIFGIEGLFTVLVGLTCYFFVADTPTKARWLSDDERNYLVLRQKYAHGPVPQSSTLQWKYVRQALCDWKGWFGCIIFWGNSIPVYGLSYTLPTIVKNLGFSAAKAQGMAAPPYIFACIVTVVVSLLSDKYKKRSLVIFSAYCGTVVGYAILISTSGKTHLTGVTLFGVFVTAASLYSALPPTMAWIANNIEGQAKRAAVLAIVPTIGQLGGVIGSHIYLSNQAPKYPVGFGVSLAAAVGCGLIGTLVMRYTLAYINRQRDKMSPEEVHARYTEEELTDMGDKSPLFRYIL
ncbi:MFS general substrate transporter [Pseudohyphozyma bogoriensis]|nr:MFS general substrate transporter [Pseudohyphozyma bogoriensis]